MVEALEATIDKLEIFGRIPSKKNSRVTTRSGRSFPSKQYVKWHKEATNQICQRYDEVEIGEIKEVQIVFRLPDNRRCDLTNKAESIMDLLVDCGVIEDDSWQVVPQLTLSAVGVDRKNPGADIWILHGGEIGDDEAK